MRIALSFRYRLTRVICLLGVFATPALTLMAQSNTFPAAGNVGIGTNAPQTTLHLQSNLDYLPQILLDSKGGVGPAYLILQKARAGTTPVLVGDSLGTILANGFSNGGYQQASYLSFPIDSPSVGSSVFSALSFVSRNANGSTSEKFRIGSNGNVGIGTNSPTSRLHLADVGYLQFNPNDGSIEVGSGNDDFSYFDFKGNSHLGEDYWGRLGYSDLGGFSLASKSASATGLALSTQGINNYLILNSGVAANSYGELSFEGTGSYAGNVYVGGAASGAIVFRNSGYLQRLVVTAGGNVGIGTTAPTHKLSVNGSIRAKEVIVETAGWADYVFAPGYALPTLAETEQHIAEHGHLPGMPSAAEVAEEGVSVGELQMKLLQKLEEMTLHQIEMQKTITSLQNRVLQLEGTHTSK